ncbi:MAG TPA: dihydropyrimidinase [Salinivirgaceae bacterium]|nr:dihydropyrimidinase [Salinivirgaceae bacterium]
MTILITGGLIYQPDGLIQSDILIKDGITVAIGNSMKTDSPATVIDATNKVVLPAGIDPHVHLHLPTPAGYSSDDFISGSKAALSGGSTMIIDFVTPTRGESLIQALEKRLEEASASMVDYSFHISPVEWTENTAAEIERCVQLGFPSFKVYLAYRQTVGVDWDTFRKIARAVANAKGILAVHAEMGDEIDRLRDNFAANGKTTPLYHLLSRPVETEYNAVKQAIEIAVEERCPIYFVHISTYESLFEIAKAQKNNAVVFAETCPHYLIFDDTVYQQPSENALPYVCSPPIRSQHQRQLLWQMLSEGKIQTIGTDHCPFSLQQKKVGLHDFRKIPNGVGGIEHRLNLLFHFAVLTKKIDIISFVKLITTYASVIFGIPENYSKIAIGNSPNLIIMNPKHEKPISASTHISNSDIDIYENICTDCCVEYVIKDGKVVVEHGRLISNPKGRLIPRTINPYLFKELCV